MRHKTKIVTVPIFTYGGIFGCYPIIKNLTFVVNEKDNKIKVTNQSFK